jgi:hypothetical protein
MRVRCRNLRCQLGLPIPTENDHKAFCTPYCYDQFYKWRCKVCEDPILKGKRRKSPDHCHKKRCRKDFRRYQEAFSYPRPTCNYDPKSAHFTGAFLGIRRAPGWHWDDTICVDEHWLYAHGRVVAIVCGADGDWKIRYPVTFPMQTAATLEAARKKAVEVALWTLPLDPATAKHIARTNRQYRESDTGRDPAPEANDDYSAIVAMLDTDNRVIRCVDDVQWIVQKREGRIWNGVYFCRTKEALLRYAASAELAPDLRREIIAREWLDRPSDGDGS